MGFFLTDIINSALTPGGTNARRKQEQGQQDVGNLGGDIARAAGADYLGAMKFGRGFDPHLQNSLQYLANSTSTAGLRDQAIAAARTNRSQLLSQQGTPSLNAYAAQGTRAANLSSAQDSENQSINNAYSPLAHAQASQAFQQALSAYKQGYGQDFQLGASTSYGQPTVQVQPGLLDYVSQLAGAYLGSQGNEDGSGTGNSGTSTKGKKS